MEGTWKKLADQVRGIRATFPAVQLVVFPEPHLSAVDQLLEETHGYAERVAVTVPGELTERLGGLARETGLWLVPGSVYERGGDGLVYNTALVLDPAGALVSTYRKCFLWQPFESTAPGREMVVFDMPGVGRLGLAICYAGTFPETYRQLAWFGAEVVLQATLTATRDPRPGPGDGAGAGERDFQAGVRRERKRVRTAWPRSVADRGPVGPGPPAGWRQRRGDRRRAGPGRGDTDAPVRHVRGSTGCESRRTRTVCSCRLRRPLPPAATTS